MKNNWIKQRIEEEKGGEGEMGEEKGGGAENKLEIQQPSSTSPFSFILFFSFS